MNDISFTITSENLGNEIYYSSAERIWRYKEDGSVLDGSKKCARCKMAETNEGHDNCIRNLPCVSFACCGHGNIDRCYTVLLDGTVIRGEDSVKIQKILKNYRK